MGDGDAQRKVIASNRKARYEYEILDTFEAGIALLGPEVKALRAGKASLGDAYADIRARSTSSTPISAPTSRRVGPTPHPCATASYSYTDPRSRAWRAGWWSEASH